MRSSTVTEEPKERTRNLWRAVAVGVSALAIATLSVGLSAQVEDDLLGPFTPGEVATWAQDRTFPTGLFESVTAFGRNDVARLGIVSADVSPAGVFYRTEGVQKADTFGDAVQVDLYLDPAWQNNATRAGVWVFDQNLPDTSAYGIIEFANLESAETDFGTGWGPNSEPFEGFRIWDSEAPVVMVNLPNVAFTYGEWVTFRIELDTSDPAHVYRYFINGVEVYHEVSAGDAAVISQVLLESFNFGANTFPTLETADYAAHWSQTPPPEPPATTTTTQPPPPPPTSPPPVIPPENLSPGDEDPGGTVTAKGGHTPLPGQLVTISLSGCAPNEFVYLRMFPGPLNLGWHQADASGRVEVHARVPASYEFGEHHVVGQCESGAVTWTTFEIVPSSFVDVPTDSPFALAIAWMERVGITQGCNPPANTMYCPTADTTRGQMAAFFVRALALPPGDDQGFIDIANSVFANAINSIAVEGITFGCNPPANDRYCPDDITSRGQMAGFFTRALNLPPAGDQGFTDIANSVFVNAINSIAAEGITRGCNPPANTNYCPEDPILRQQMAAFFLRAYVAGNIDNLGPF